MHAVQPVPPLRAASIAWRLALAASALLAAASAEPAAAQSGASTPAPAAGGVTIYRCTDSRGQLSVRDTPCQSGQRQQTVQMQRPVDPPPRTASTTAAPPEAPPTVIEREVRIVTVQPPQPMYVCTAPDGEEYVSEDGEGNPRWVPLWTTGWPVVGPGPYHPSRPPVHGPRPPSPPGRPGHGPGPRPPHGAMPVAVGGTWVRDACQRMSQQDVCRRLSDRRYEILRVYGAGMPSDRRALDREQQGIDARMRNDCPGY